MQGRVVNFRGNIRMQRYNYLLITVPGIDSKEKATSLVGKTVLWKSPANREIQGKITAPHGDGGTIRAIFEQGMPGQCLGTVVDIQ